MRHACAAKTERIGSTRRDIENAAAQAAQPAVIDTLQKLVLIESGSANLAGLAKVADFAQARLEALGAKTETFMGLSGLGDLVLTATGDLSRNRKVGLALAQGMTLQQAVDSLGHVAEGVYCARTVVQRAQHLGVEMPIAQAVVALLDGDITPAQAVAVLMGRGAKGEN